MRIRITKGGIYSATGEIAVGTELDLKEAPAGWAGRYEVVGGSGTTAVTGDEKKDDGEKSGLKYEAKHKGGPVWAIYEGETIVRDKLAKSDAEEFNKLDTAEGQDAWLAAHPVTE